MPRTPIDYKKAIIYSIVSKTDETLLYIGSTTDFRKRKNKHKSDCNTETSNAHLTPVYLMIRANGGWDAFEMKPIKEFPCENKIQLLIEEERIRKEMNAILNTKKAFETQEEIRERTRAYKQQHKEEIREQMKEYREKHKEEMKISKSIYYHKTKVNS